MKLEDYRYLKKHFKDIQENVPLAPYTTFKIGGPADLFYEAREMDKLIELIELAKSLNISYVVIGNGSNILVADSGFRGLVIKNSCRNFEIKDNLIVAESGASLPQILHEAAGQGIGQNIWVLANIPGTIGGAVYGNAGSILNNQMVSIGDFLVKAKILAADGNINEVDRDYFDFSYRSSKLKQNQETVLQVILADSKGESTEILKMIDFDKRQRMGKYPAYPFAGSFFKNPPHSRAGELIEQCGLKGQRVGEAMVSEKHANYIVNLGKAKAVDVLELARMIKKRVKEKFGVELQEEIQYLGVNE